MTERQSPQKSAPNIAKQLISRITKFEKIRFVLVGGLNTSVDFIILIVLVSLLGFPSFIANIISTSIALVVSYALNKKSGFR